MTCEGKVARVGRIEHVHCRWDVNFKNARRKVAWEHDRRPLIICKVSKNLNSNIYYQTYYIIIEDIHHIQATQTPKILKTTYKLPNLQKGLVS